MAPTRMTESTSMALYMAMELSQATWRLAFGTSPARKPRERQISARDVSRLGEEIAMAKRRFGLPEDVAVLSCFEAGRDGFWLHRCLEGLGLVSSNVVADSASIEVKRRAHHAKSDRLDVLHLLRLLQRYHGGERKALSVVRVPSETMEDLRHYHRELRRLKKERTALTNAIKSHLATQGVVMPLRRRDFLEQLAAVRLWDSAPLSSRLARRLLRMHSRWELLDEQILEVEKARRNELRENASLAIVRQLHHVKGIGEESAWTFGTEFFLWRKFRNRREVGSLAGLTPVPYRSGSSHRDYGIDRAGNRWVRPLVIEIAWGWLRFQPQSQLSQWFQTRYGPGGKRLRRIGIVALARKLLIALWRYLETGEPPAGAVLKAR